MMCNVLRFGPIGNRALHVSIDMQRIFAELGTFFCPGLASIIPVVSQLTAHQPSNTVFTRYVAPAMSELSGGGWQENYRQWVNSALGSLDKSMFESYSAPFAICPSSECNRENNIFCF